MCQSIGIDKYWFFIEVHVSVYTGIGKIEEILAVVLNIY